MDVSPVAMFVYNRPDHALKVLNALNQNYRANETLLKIFCDGPKSAATTDEIQRIEQVRAVVRSFPWAGKIEIKESTQNSGLSVSLRSGITEMTEEYGEVIVLEDDIFPSKNFLSYCNQGLRKYAEEKSVFQIGGFNYYTQAHEQTPFFSRIPYCWGWATWKRAWVNYNNDAASLFHQIEEQKKVKLFNLNNAYPYSSLLHSQAEKKINSWSICWYASLFLQNGLTLLPSISLTRNIGMDGTGTHWQGNSGFHQHLYETDHDLAFRLPADVIVNESLEHEMEKVVRKMMRPGYRQRISQKMRKIFLGSKK